MHSVLCAKRRTRKRLRRQFRTVWSLLNSINCIARAQGAHCQGREGGRRCAFCLLPPPRRAAAAPRRGVAGPAALPQSDAPQASAPPAFRCTAEADRAMARRGWAAGSTGTSSSATSTAPPPARQLRRPPARHCRSYPLELAPRPWRRPRGSPAWPHRARGTRRTTALPTIRRRHRPRRSAPLGVRPGRRALRATTTRCTSCPTTSRSCLGPAATVATATRKWARRPSCWTTS